MTNSVNQQINYDVKFTFLLTYNGKVFFYTDYAMSPYFQILFFNYSSRFNLFGCYYECEFLFYLYLCHIFKLDTPQEYQDGNPNPLLQRHFDF